MKFQIFFRLEQGRFLISVPKFGPKFLIIVPTLKCQLVELRLALGGTLEVYGDHVGDGLRIDEMVVFQFSIQTLGTRHLAELGVNVLPAAIQQINSQAIFNLANACADTLPERPFLRLRYPVPQR